MPNFSALAPISLNNLKRSVHSFFMYSPVVVQFEHFVTVSAFFGFLTMCKLMLSKVAARSKILSTNVALMRSK